MTKQRVCKVCEAIETKNAKFPRHSLVCNDCLAKRERQRYQEKKESIKAQKGQYNAEHKEHIAERSARYHREHRETINAKDRQEYAEEAKYKPPRLCIDCGEPMPKRARLYCASCKEKHRIISVRDAMQRMRRK
jgi:TPP-dependent indolepyruvate ferredoxin oxidoreductase alpha subunit